ncbi:hypothetical protein [Bifidobacterium aerophilum]|uniref:Uncharacterized protein n=1 Tax=Bifidobacterium aerophilum TaxID=1798155 RepID=A0A6N9Z7X5_9BIFI|nr:hypothetical protein [Bifidobacterium aerophilum]NEG90490.1 hypothetical protein [Bifidobacterium aerophilum]
MRSFMILPLLNACFWLAVGVAVRWLIPAMLMSFHRFRLAGLLGPDQWGAILSALFLPILIPMLPGGSVDIRG